MRIDVATRHFESNLDMAPQAFQIANSAKAFQILSDALYENKPLAILRELVANAVDAHVAAGTTDTPFIVHLPTELEPWFEVEDFGTGLSQEGIHSLYTTYFGSNKTESNEQIGGFGLGSKSPFAYTDQFFVDSRYNGTLTKYSIYIASTGVPMVAALSTEPTDQPNGLTVRVPTSTRDINMFNEAALTILPFVTIAMTCNKLKESIEAARPTHTHEYQVDDAVIHRRDKNHDDPFVRVIMGIVPYPVDFDALDMGLPYHIQHQGHYGFDFYMPIGSVEVSASREGLSYNNNTRATLSALVKKALLHVAETAREKFDNAPTLFEAMKERALLNAYDSLFDYAHTQLGAQNLKGVSYDHKLLWQGVPLRFPLATGMTMGLHDRRSYGRRKWTEYSIHSGHGNGDLGSWNTRFLNGLENAYWTDQSEFRPWLEDNSISLPVVVLHGSQQQVEEFFDHMGIDFSTCTYIPKYKRTRAKRIASGKPPEEKKYKFDGSESTADDIIDWMQRNKSVKVYFEDLHPPLFSTNHERVKSVAVPRAHSRVVAKLKAAGVYDSNDELLKSLYDITDPLAVIRIVLCSTQNVRYRVVKAKQLLMWLEEHGATNVFGVLDPRYFDLTSDQTQANALIKLISPEILDEAKAKASEFMGELSTHLEAIVKKYPLLFGNTNNNWGNRDCAQDDYRFTASNYAEALIKHYIQLMDQQGANDAVHSD